MAFSSNSQFYYYFFIALVIFTITGCGGGGGDGIAPSQTTTNPSISGSFTAAAGSFIDSDVNDPLAPYLSNNTTPQDIDNPFIVGGYASTFLVSGRNEIDNLDRYRVTLVQGQTVTLSVSNHISATPGTNDLDLYLIDINENIISSSLGTSATESISITADDTYIIEVHVNSGSSNYVLTVSASVSSDSTGKTLRLEDDFVPGEMIIQFKEEELLTSTSKAFLLQPTLPGLRTKAGRKGMPMLYTFTDKNQRFSSLAALGVPQKNRHILQNQSMDNELSLKFDTIQAIKALRKRSDILSVDPNYRRYPSALIPNDQYYPLQWHYPLINLPQAWDFASTNSFGAGDITVAIVDTGVFMTHPDLTANLLATGYDFIRDPSISLDGDGIDPDPNDPGDNIDPNLRTYHGTHVAGTVAAATNNGPNTGGVAGVSWDGSGNVKLMPIRVLGFGGGNSFDLIRGVRYAAGLPADYPGYPQLNPSDRADIINMSLSGRNTSAAEENTFSEIRNAGVLCIAAAGNKSSNISEYPASYPDVISVSAVDKSKQQAWYSNFGTKIDVTAPGGDQTSSVAEGVLSTTVNNNNGLPTYGYKTGTSMATPHISGVAALMKSIYPGLSPFEFETLLTAGSITEDLGTIGRDEIFGYGLIDALKAVQEAENLLINGGILLPFLTINPPTLNFGTSQNSITFTTANGGDGSLTILQVTKTAPWLTVSAPSPILANGLGTYTATVDRTGLLDAVYSTTIAIDTDIPETLQIPVSMQVNASGGANNDVGFHYVLLLDQATGNTVTELNASNSSGSYSFSFSDVSPGTYYIVAGTDSDNDGSICDPGEACGGYPTITQLTPIIINTTDVNSITFISGFAINFSSSSIEYTMVPSQGYSRLPNKRLSK